MAAPRKRFSDEVDKLLNKVNKLVNDGMSVNKACKEVGLQPTVYYFRKRKEDAMKLKSNVPAASKENTYANSPSTNRNNSSANKSNTQKLIEEARQLEDRLRELKEQILESVMSK